MKVANKTSGKTKKAFVYLGIVTIILFAIYACASDDSSSETTTEDPDATTSEWVIRESPIIDMHAHTGGIQFSMLTEQEHLTQSYAKFDEYNVVKAAVSGPSLNESELSSGAAWYAQDAERVIPGVMVTGVGSPSVDELQQAYDAGNLQIIGEVGFYYTGMYAYDDMVRPYFALAEELGIPIAYHLMENASPANSNPNQFQDVLDDYPDLKIYIMHAGFPHTEDIKSLLENYPNLYVDISWIASEDIGSEIEFMDFLQDLVESGYSQRIMFGSDTVVSPAIFDRAVSAIDDLEFLTGEQKADIFYYNAARFLELSQDEIDAHWETN